MLYNSSWKYVSCSRYSNKSFGLGFELSYVRYSSSLKRQLISLSNSFILNLPSSVSFYRFVSFELLFQRSLSPFKSISSSTLSLLLCEKPQANCQWMLLKARHSPCRRHGHRNQSLDTLMCILSHPSCLIVGITPSTCCLLWSFTA